MPMIFSTPLNVRSDAFGATGDGTTDDTVAIQNAINAAAGAGGGVVYFPAGTYRIAGTPVTRTGITYAGAATSSTAQLMLPDVPITSQGGVTVVLAGPGMLHRTPSLIGTTPAPAGQATLVSDCTTAGAALLGGISADSTYPFSNITLVIQDLAFQLPANPVISGLDLSYIAAVDLNGVTVHTGAYAVGAITQPTHAGSTGILLPANSNGAWSVARRTYVLGCYTGMRVCEHADLDACGFFGCLTAMELPAADHAIKVGRVVAQTCPTILRATGACRLVAQQLDIERAPAGNWWSPGNEIEDASNLLAGRVLVTVTDAGTGPSTNVGINGASHLVIEKLGAAGIV